MSCKEDMGVYSSYDCIVILFKVKSKDVLKEFIIKQMGLTQSNKQSTHKNKAFIPHLDVPAVVLINGVPHQLEQLVFTPASFLTPKSPQSTS